MQLADGTRKPVATERMHKIFICRSCADDDAAPAGPDLAARLRARLSTSAEFGMIEVVDSRCMLSCGKPIAVSLTCPGKMSYLFADVDAATDLGNLVTLIRLYRDSPGGAINDARPVGRLRHCLLGRLPT